MKVYVLNTEELGVSMKLENWISILPEKIAEDILAYKKEADQWRVTGGKVLLKYALQLEEEELDLSSIHETDKGRLFFEGSSFNFNISHSGKYVVLVTAKDMPCGIDVEWQRKVNIDMFRRLFSDGEWDVIQESGDPQALFFRCWAIKESVIKADGRGVEVISKTEIMSNEEAVCDGDTWYYKVLDIDPNYSAAVTSNQAITEEVLGEPELVDVAVLTEQML